ncbi:MAG TPA: BON domain-containing protein [Longimicrobiales bacterium]
MKGIERLEGFVAGLAVGAGLMFLLDPGAGRRRRALIRDKVVRAGHEISDSSGEMRTRVRNRVKGIVAETRGRFSTQDVDDSVLEARVRSSMGRVLSNPGAIAVLAEGGRVTISGPVLAAEVDGLLSCVKSVPGVQEVHSQLAVRPSPDNVPGLQRKDPFE